MSKLKSRNGAALVIALVVVLVGGALITVLFDFVAQYAFFSSEEKVWYVDHTTLVSYTQAMKGRIIADNIANWEMRHVPALSNPDNPPADYSLDSSDLCFDGDWRIAKTQITGNNVGPQQVEVEVYDMVFNLRWIDRAALLDKDFPSSFRLLSTPPERGDLLGDETSTGGGDYVEFVDLNEDLKSYGAYLVRVKLYDSTGSRVIRTAEEVFVQILPERSS